MSRRTRGGTWFPGRKGVALVVVVAALPALLASVAMALELVTLRGDRAALRNVAELAAHAGAVALLHDPGNAAGAEGAARANAERNGAIFDEITLEIAVSQVEGSVEVVAASTWSPIAFGDLFDVPEIPLSARGRAVAEADGGRIRIVAPGEP